MNTVFECYKTLIQYWIILKRIQWILLHFASLNCSKHISHCWMINSQTQEHDSIRSVKWYIVNQCFFSLSFQYFKTTWLFLVWAFVFALCMIFFFRNFMSAIVDRMRVTWSICKFCYIYNTHMMVISILRYFLPFNASLIFVKNLNFNRMEIVKLQKIFIKRQICGKHATQFIDLFGSKCFNPFGFAFFAI